MATVAGGLKVKCSRRRQLSASLAAATPTPFSAVCSCLRDCIPSSSKPTPVLLHVYDVGRSAIVNQLNNGLSLVGHKGGLFHVAIEVNGWEWSFGKTDSAYESGIHKCEPRQNSSHRYRCTVPLRPTPLNVATVDALLTQLTSTASAAGRKWRGTQYNVLRHNCCHFCEFFAVALCAGPLPKWILASSNTAAKIDDKAGGVGAVAADTLSSHSSKAAPPMRKGTPLVKRATSFDLRPVTNAAKTAVEATVAGGTAAVEATVAGGRAIVRQLSFDSSPRAERVLKRRVANGTTRDELL